MLKAIGAALIACAVTGVGIWTTEREKRRVRALEEAMESIVLLKASVTRRLLPLKEAMEELQHQSKWMQCMAQTDSGGYEQALEQLGLGREETEILMTLLRTIPRAAAHSTEHFDSAQEQLAQRLKARKTAAERTSALYPKLGLLGGAAVFLMLI